MPHEKSAQTDEPSDHAGSPFTSESEPQITDEPANAYRRGPGFNVLATAAIATGVGLLLQNSEVRTMFRNVLHDPAVSKACHEAGQMVCGEIAASWRRHGGVTVLANAFLH